MFGAAQDNVINLAEKDQLPATGQNSILFQQKAHGSQKSRKPTKNEKRRYEMWNNIMWEAHASGGLKGLQALQGRVKQVWQKNALLAKIMKLQTT